MARLSISRAWDEARQVLRSEGKLLTTVALALILLPQAIAGVLAPPKELSGEEPAGWVGIVALIVGLIGILAQIAIVRLSLRRGTSVGEAIGHAARRFIPAFLAILLFVAAALLVCLPVLIAVAGPDQLQSIAAGEIPPNLAWVILLLMLVLVLVGVRLQMIMPVASEESGGPVRLLKRSWQLTGGSYWRLLAFLLIALIAALVVMFVAAIVGGILARAVFGEIEAMSLGALVLALIAAAVQAAFSVVITVMLARIYAQLAGAAPVPLAEPSVPSSGT